MLKRFNKLLALVVAVVLLISALGISASAAPVVPSLTIGTASGAGGSDVTVNITAQNFNSVCGMEFYINFNGLTLKSVTSTVFTLKQNENYAISSLGGNVLSFVESGEAGTVSDTINPLVNTNSSTTVMTLTFTIPKSATLNQKFEVSFLTTAPRKSIFADTNSALITNVSLVNGSVTCNKAVPQISFGDVTDESIWFYDAVMYCAENKYINGYASNNLFGALDAIKRQDFVCILANYCGADLSGYQNKNYFPDVPVGTYYTGAVNWAYENGVVSGYSNGYFGAGDLMAREQLVTMLYNFAKQYYKIDVTADGTKAQSMVDYGQVSSWAKAPIEWAIDKGAISGKGGTNIAPYDAAARCEIAQIIKNIDDRGIFKK